MIWDRVVDGALEMIAMDPTIQGVMGSEITLRFGGDPDPERQFRVPSLDGSVVSNMEEELDESVLLQIDSFARTTEEILTVERRLRAMFHCDLPVDIGGRGVWTQLADRRRIPGTGGEILGISLDFRMEAVRDRYQRDGGSD